MVAGDVYSIQLEAGSFSGGTFIGTNTDDFYAGGNLFISPGYNVFGDLKFRTYVTVECDATAQDVYCTTLSSSSQVNGVSAISTECEGSTAKRNSALLDGEYGHSDGALRLYGLSQDVTSLDQAQESSSTSSPGGSGVPVPDPGDTLVPKLYSWSIRSINIVLISIRTEVSLVNANVTIRSGEGIGGTALYTGVWTFSSVTAANHWITYDLTGGPSCW